MRPVALACLIVLAVAGCDDKPLTGPEARRAVVQAQHSNGKLPSGTVVVVATVVVVVVTVVVVGSATMKAAPSMLKGRAWTSQ